MMRESTFAPSARGGFWLLIALLALLAAGKTVLYDTLDPDCFWHLRVAAQLHRDGIGPIVDDLSFASNKQPWTPYSWLAELGMKALWDAGGFRAAVAVTAIMQATLVVLLALCGLEVQQGAGKRSMLNTFPQPYLPTAVATAIGTFLILPYLSFRPVTLAFVLLFAIAWLVVRDQKIYGNSGGKRIDRWVWNTIPLTILLTNIHLFSFFVPAIMFAMALGSVIEKDTAGARRYSLLATTTAIACLATPMLPGLLKTIFFYSAQDKMVTGPVISEMQWFARGPMGWIAGAGVAMMLGCIAMRYQAVRIGQLICVAVATLLLLKLGRFAPLFALSACPVLAATLPGLKDRMLAKPAIQFLLIGVLFMGGVRVVGSFPARSIALPTWVNRHGKDTPGYPCAAADFLDSSVPHPTGHLINEFSWGGYLAWRLAGKFQVLLDGRTQVYPQALWQATYLGSDEDRLRFLASLDADAALVPLVNSKFRRSLIELHWKPAFKDDRAEVLLPPASIAKIE